MSLAEWFLKIVQFADWGLHELNDPVLFKLREEVQNEDVYSELRRFITFKTFKRPTETSTDVTINIDPRYEQEARNEAIKQITAIQEGILKTAGLICTTPIAGARNPYTQLHKTARAVMTDEAGAMSPSPTVMLTTRK
ncbi:hypothetical protein ACHAPD_001809 [Fusarium lateritium]